MGAEVVPSATTRPSIASRATLAGGTPNVYVPSATPAIQPFQWIVPSVVLGARPPGLSRFATDARTIITDAAVTATAIRRSCVMIAYDTMPRMPSAGRAAILATALFISFAYFYEGGGWHQNTRFDLVRAIVENGTVRIDLYHENTGDKAHVGVHYFMDKAPGGSLVAGPLVGLVRGLMRIAGAKLYSHEAIVLYSYVATLAASAVPAVLAALCVFWMSRRCGADDGAATIAAVVCGL